MQIAGLPYKETAVPPQHISAAAQKVDLLRFGSASHTSIGKIAAKSYTLVLKKNKILGGKKQNLMAVTATGPYQCCCDRRLCPAPGSG